MLSLEKLSNSTVTNKTYSSSGTVNLLFGTIFDLAVNKFLNKNCHFLMIVYNMVVEYAFMNASLEL